MLSHHLGVGVKECTPCGDELIGSYGSRIHKLSAGEVLPSKTHQFSLFLPPKRRDPLGSRPITPIGSACTDCHYATPLELAAPVILSNFSYHCPLPIFISNILNSQFYNSESILTAIFALTELFYLNLYTKVDKNALPFSLYYPL